MVKITHSVCSQTRSGLRFGCVQTGPGLWQRKPDLGRQWTQAVLQGRAPAVRHLRRTVLQHCEATFAVKRKTEFSSRGYLDFFILLTFGFYLRVGPVEFRIDFFKCVHRRQGQSFSQTVVTLQTEVSSSLDG